MGVISKILKLCPSSTTNTSYYRVGIMFAYRVLTITLIHIDTAMLKESIA